MTSAALFGLSVAFGFAAWGAVAALYIWPALRKRSTADALKPILLLHAFRYEGLAFLLPGVVTPALPASFARPAAIGDFASAGLALLALALLNTRGGTVAAWIWSVVGIADLLNAFYLGSLVGLPQIGLGVAYFIIAAYVPLLFITHILGFRLLWRTRAVPSRLQASVVN